MRVLATFIALPSAAALISCGSGSRGDDLFAEGGRASAAEGGEPATVGGAPEGGGQPSGGRGDDGAAGNTAGSEHGGSSVGGSSGGSGTGGSSPGGSGTSDPGGSSSGGQAGADGGGQDGGGKGGSAGRPGGLDCAEQRRTLSQLLDEAQACSLAEERGCVGFVDDECGCRVPVNDPSSAASERYAAAVKQFSNECGAVCLDVLCAVPRNATCRRAAGGEARCAARAFTGPGSDF